MDKLTTLFKSIVGSQAYGTAIPTSDTDIKGVFMQDVDTILGFGYKGQYEVGKDETYYEIKRFLELLASANPTVLELLYAPKDCILEKHPLFDILIENRDKFLTKKCRDSFGGYAVQQIRKARGLDKKMNWEKEKTVRKTVLDFCYITPVDSDFQSIPLKVWLKKEGKKQEHCGLSGLDHFRFTYSLFYDHGAELKSDNPRFEGKGYGYKGIVQDEENSNAVSLSSIPKFAQREAILQFNSDGYSSHCKDYKEYQVWLENRNTQRYVDNKSHDQKVDGKNLMHARRLLDVALDIPIHKAILVRSPPAEYLLKIRRGEVNLEELIAKAEEDIKLLDAVYDNCDLPSRVDGDFLNEILLKFRKA